MAEEFRKKPRVQLPDLSQKSADSVITLGVALWLLYVMLLYGSLCW
jgi:hypothetical protein